MALIPWRQFRRVKFFDSDYLEAQMSSGGKLARLNVSQVQDGALMLERYLRYTSSKFNVTVDIRELTTA